jgi:hypothetical protein
MVGQSLPGWFPNDFREIKHISRDRSFLVKFLAKLVPQSLQRNQAHTQKLVISG